MVLTRPLATQFYTLTVQQFSTKLTDNKDATLEDEEKKQGWISRILSTPSAVDKQSHSSMLSDTEAIYEFQTHDVKGGERDAYVQKYRDYAKEVNAAVPGNKLIGSWNVLFGNQDQSIHLWQYGGGYADVDRYIDSILHNNSVRVAEKDVNQLVRRRRSVLVRSFSYWGEPKPREPNHIYDLRTYVLQPGSMIEWGNAWAKGIQYRTEHNQNVAGFFTQIGQLYMVFHIWAYAGMVARQHIRQDTWLKPGWDSTVAYTVPLIKEMKSKILIPNDFSTLR